MSKIDDILYGIADIDSKVRALPQGPLRVGSLTAVASAVAAGEPSVELIPGDYDRLVIPPGVGTQIDLSGSVLSSIATTGPAVGLTIKGGRVKGQNNGPQELVAIGSSVEPTLANQPRGVTIIGTDVEGAPAGQKRGFSMHGSNLSLINVKVTEIKLQGQDSQAVWLNNGPGPYLVTRSHLEAAGENLILGGDDPRIPNCIPSDVYIGQNTLTKPASWRGSAWQVKNLLEVKLGKRVRIEGNSLSNNWVAAQAGYAVLFTVRNQGGNCPWAVVEDIDFVGNDMRNVSSGIIMHGDDDERPSLRTSRVNIVNNYIEASRSMWGGDGRGICHRSRTTGDLVYQQHHRQRWQCADLHLQGWNGH
jgi:hypothetical protein